MIVMNDTYLISKDCCVSCLQDRTWWPRRRKTSARGPPTRAPSCWSSRRSSCSTATSRGRGAWSWRWPSASPRDTSRSGSRTGAWSGRRRRTGGGWGAPTRTRTPPSPLGTRGRPPEGSPPRTDPRPPRRLSPRCTATPCPLLGPGSPHRPARGQDRDSERICGNPMRFRFVSPSNFNIHAPWSFLGTRWHPETNKSTVQGPPSDPAFTGAATWIQLHWWSKNQLLPNIIFHLQHVSSYAITFLCMYICVMRLYVSTCT